MDFRNFTNHFAHGHEDLIAPATPERHQLDEADMVGFVKGESRQRFNFVFIDAAHHHCVDLDRNKTRLLSLFKALQYLRQAIFPGDLNKTVASESV
jgi:hypothetical protein